MVPAAARRAALPLLLPALLGACAGEEPRARASSLADSAVSVVDDAGRTVRLARPARRIVSLLPAGNEALLALGAGDRIVGRTRYDEMPELAGLPSVGGGLDPSLEALAALRPDLVLAWEPPGGSRVRARLEELGIAVLALETRDTAAIFRTIHNLGHLSGRGAAADSLARHVRARLDSVRASVPPGPRPRVLYVVSVDPPMLAGTDNFLAELIGVAGGEPVGVSAGHKGHSPQVSREELLRIRPDVVVLPVGEDPTASVERLRAEPGWREMPAVREGRVVTVPADLMNRPGPEIGESARVLRDAIRSVRGGEPR